MLFLKTHSGKVAPPPKGAFGLTEHGKKLFWGLGSALT